MPTAIPKKISFYAGLLGLLLLAAPAPSYAEAMILPFIKGPGAERCIDYITVFNQPSDKYRIYIGWLQGYASRIGLEQAIRKGRIVDYLNGTSVDDMAAWLNDWCARHPFNSFYLAGTAFIKHASGEAPIPERKPLAKQGKNPAAGDPGRK